MKSKNIFDHILFTRNATTQNLSCNRFPYVVRNTLNDSLPRKKDYWKSSLKEIILVALLVCCSELTYKPFIIFPNFGKIFFQAALVGWFFKGIVKWVEPGKCDILLVSRLLCHNRITPSLKEWTFSYLILTGDFPP